MPSCPSMLNFWDDRVQPLDLSFPPLKGNVPAPIPPSDIVPNGHLRVLHVLVFHGTFAIFTSDPTVWKKFSVLHLCSFCLSVCFLLPGWHPAIPRSFNLLTVADTTTLISSCIPLWLRLNLSQSRILRSLGRIYSPTKSSVSYVWIVSPVLLDISFLCSKCLILLSVLSVHFLPPFYHHGHQHPTHGGGPSFLPGLGDWPKKSSIWMLGMFPVCFLTDHQNHVTWDPQEKLLFPVFFIYMKEYLNGMAICVWFCFQCLSIMWPVCMSFELGII